MQGYFLRLYLLRKLYFGCRQSYISADAEVAVIFYPYINNVENVVNAREGTAYNKSLAYAF